MPLEMIGEIDIFDNFQLQDPYGLSATGEGEVGLAVKRPPGLLDGGLDEPGGDVAAVHVGCDGEFHI